MQTYNSGCLYIYMCCWVCCMHSSRYCCSGSPPWYVDLSSCRGPGVARAPLSFCCTYPASGAYGSSSRPQRTGRAADPPAWCLDSEMLYPSPVVHTSKNTCSSSRRPSDLGSSTMRLRMRPFHPKSQAHISFGLSDLGGFGVFL